MAIEDDFNLDDFTFDDFEDFDGFPDETGSDVKDDRKPITKAKDVFTKQTSKTLKDTSFYSRIVRKALPVHYREALDTVDEIKAQGRDLYNSAVERSSPTVRELKKRSQKLIPKAQKYLPEALAKKIENLLQVNEEYNTQFSEAKQREEQINLTMAEVFKQQLENQDSSIKEKRATDVFQEAVNNKRHEQSIATFESIREGISRLVGYQDNIAIRYQQKSLELKYRQLFATRDIVTESQRQSRETSELLRTIVKNTGLPDAVKLQQMEHFGFLTRERIINRIQDGIGGSIQGLVGRIGNNLRTKVMERVGGFSDVLDQAMATADMGGGMPDPAAMAGQVGSGVATEYLSDNIAQRLGKRLGKNKVIRSTNARLGAALGNAPSFLRSFANTDPNLIADEDRRWWEIDDSPYEMVNGQLQRKGMLKNAMGSLLGVGRSLLQENGGVDDLSISDASGTMHQPVPFSKRMGLSITDVIPGLLARSLRELTMLRTGGDAPLMAYNFGSGNFTSVKDLKGDINSRVTRKVGKANVRYQLDQVYEGIDPEKKLNETQRKALDRHLVMNARQGGGFDVKRLSNENFYDQSIDAQTRKELANHFREQFITSRTGGKYDHADIDERVRDNVQNYQGLMQSIPAVLDELELQLSLGNKEVLEEMGLLVKENGVSRFNFDKILDMLLDSEASGPAPSSASTASGGLGGSNNPMGGASSGPSAVQTMRDAINRQRIKITGAVSSRTGSAKLRLNEFRQHAKSVAQQYGERINLNGRPDEPSLANRGQGAEAVESVSESLKSRYESMTEAAKAEYDKVQAKLNEKLRNENLRDEVTGGAIKSLNDLKNNVVDKAGIVVISIKDLKNTLANIDNPFKAFRRPNVASAEQQPNAEAEESYSNRQKQKQVEVGGEIPDLLQRLIEIQVGALGQLNAINDTLMAGINIGADGKIAGRMNQRHGVMSGLKHLLGGTLAMGGSLARGTGDFYKKVFGGMGSLVGGGLGMAGNVLKMGNKMAGGLFFRQSDIFVKGQPYPAMFAKGIRQGIYEDVTTGKIIKSIKDIKGPVRDMSDDGNIVITAEDYAKGLFDTKGKSIVRSSVQWLGKFYGAMFSPLITAARLTNRAMWGIAGVVTRKKDVYTKDDLTVPKLYARVMLQGGYFSAATGKTIKSVSDIDGPVKDTDDVIVLSNEDLRTGLCDSRGKPITSLSEKVVNLAKGVIGLGVKAVTGTLKASIGALKMGWRFGKGVMKAITNKINVRFGSPEEAQLGMASQSVGILEAIYQLLDERLPGKKKVLGDVDGDGDRENSWQDILSRRKAKAEEEARVKGAADPGKSMWGKLSGALAGLFGKKGTEEEGEEEGDTIITGDLFGGDGEKEDDKKKKKTKPKGKFGRFMSGIGDKLKKIPGMGKMGAIGRAGLGMAGRVGLGLGASALGTSLMGGGSALLAGAGTVLAGVGAVLASPIFLGALAVGAIAYLGYRWYKSRKGQSELRDIRYLQYGLHPDNEDGAKKVAYLEGELAQYVKFQGETANIDVDMGTLEKIMAEFGVQTDNTADVERFVQWYSGRFKPIFVRHRAAANSLKPNATLEEADKDFSPSMKLSYLTKIDFPANAEGSPYSVFITPFTREGSMFGVKAISDAIAAAREYFTKEAEKEGSKTVANTVAGTAAATTATLAKPSDAQISGGSDPAKADFNAMAKTRTISGSSVRWGAGTVAVGGTSPNLTESKTLSVLDMIRYKAYGLTTFEIDKVGMLRQLEKETLAKITFNGKGIASLQGSGEDFAKLYASLFGVANTDPEQYLEWILWFNNRFAPVLVEFCTAVKRVVDLANMVDAVTYLTGEEKIGVAAAISGARTGLFGRSIWSITNTPWKGYAINTDSGSVQGNIEVLKSEAKQREIMDRVKAMTNVIGPEPTVDASKPFTMTKRDSQVPTVPTTPTQTSANPYKAFPDGRRSYYGVATKSVTGGKYMMPAEGTVNSEFGNRIHPITGGKKQHKGIDIRAPQGTPIVAAADGIITRRDFSQSYGNVIYIKHDDGNVTRYAHMSSFQPGFSVGSRVNQGDLIGYVGSTGNSTGPHLHFEVRKGDKPDAEVLDPMSLIDDRFSGAAKKEVDAAVKAAQTEAQEAKEFTAEGEDTIASTLVKDSQPAPTNVAASGTHMNNSLASRALAKPGLTERSNAIPVADISRSDALRQVAAPTDRSNEQFKATREARAMQIEQRDAVRAQADTKVTKDLASIMEKSLEVQRSSNSHLGNIHGVLQNIQESLANRAAPEKGNVTMPSITGNRPSTSTSRQNVVDISKASVR